MSPKDIKKMITGSNGVNIEFKTSEKQISTEILYNEGAIEGATKGVIDKLNILLCAIIAD